MSRAANPVASGRRRTRLALASLLVVSTLVAYAPALKGGFVWDDDDHVTENTTLRSLEGLRRIWFELGAVPQYYPLLHTTFWIEYHLWGARPFGYHLTNVLLHTLCALLLWKVLTRLEVPGAWAAAALFALHPIQVESVAWVTERKNVLSGTFYLLAAIAYLRRSGIGTSAPSHDGGWRGWTPAYLLFLCALLSKTVTATFPAAIAVVLWWKRGRLERGHALRLASMIAIGAVFGAITAWTEAHGVGANGKEWAFGALGRLTIAGRAFWFYLGKLIWPHPLVFVYPRWSVENVSAAALLFPLTAVAFLTALWAARNRIGRGPLAAFLLYGGTLAPALGFVNVYPMRFSFVADHFAYLATIGPLALVAAAGAIRLGKIDGVAPETRKRLSAVLVALVLGVLGSLTWSQGRAYRDEETLWRDTLRKNPDAFIASNNLGGILLLADDLPRAEEQFLAALRAKPDFPDALDNLGVVRQRQGRIDEAAALYREALKHDPSFADAHNNLGIVLATKGKVAEAIEHFSEAVRLRSTFANARSNLALALESVGRTAEALREYREALQISPQSTDVAVHLAWILATHPDAGLRNGSEAVGIAESACAATGYRDPAALDALAAAHAETGRFDAAVRIAERAIELGGSSPAEASVHGMREQRLELYRSGRPFRSGKR